MQRKKKAAVVAACAVLAVLLVVGLFGGAFLVLRGLKNAQLGGLVGEMLADRDKHLQLFPETTSESQTDREQLTTMPDQNPPKPIFCRNAADIQAAAYMGTVSQDGSYVSFYVDQSWYHYYTALIKMGDTYKNVQYIAIAYRTWSDGQGGFDLQGRIATSGAPHRVSLNFDYIGDGEWHTLVFDISQKFPDNPHHYLSTLDLTILASPKQGQSIDIACIAGFSSRQEAEAYFQTIVPAS